MCTYVTPPPCYLACVHNVLRLVTTDELYDLHPPTPFKAKHRQWPRDVLLGWLSEVMSQWTAHTRAKVGGIPTSLVPSYEWYLTRRGLQTCFCCRWKNERFGSWVPDRRKTNGIPVRGPNVVRIGSEVILYRLSRGSSPSKTLMRATPAVEYACSTHDYLFFPVLSREHPYTSTQNCISAKLRVQPNQQRDQWAILKHGKKIL